LEVLRRGLRLRRVNIERTEPNRTVNKNLEPGTGNVEPPSRPLRVALTGGIATGKSYVRARFEALGVPTSDADVIARAVVAPGTPGFDAVVRRFGRDILAASGAIDRKRLGAIVFADPAKRHALEAIVHPAVRKATDEWFASLPAGTPIAISDIPLLYETGRDRDFDRVIVAAAEPAEQLRRVMKRDGLSEGEARQRVAAQLPIDEKAKRADYVIGTGGTFEDTDRQVRGVFGLLTDAASAAR
jgi:dephospho-CoA kinase